MEKEVKWNGITRVPSDYSCNDGDLFMSINLINEDGELRGIEQPSLCAEIVDSGGRNSDVKILLLHKTSLGENIIILKRGLTSQLYWQEWSDNTRMAGIDTANFMADINGYKDSSVIGNTLIVSTEDGLRYFLWSEGVYKPLGERPPFVAVEFELKSCSVKGNGNIIRSFITLDEEDSKIVDYEYLRGMGMATDNPGRPSSALTHGRYVRRLEQSNSLTLEITNFVMGLVAKCDNAVYKNGCVSNPFFIRYAYRMYDGSHTLHSSPIYMQANFFPVTARFTSLDEKEGVKTIHSSAECSAHKICCKMGIDERGMESLKLWKDLITGIDVYISSPLRQYDMGATELDFPSLTTGNAFAEKLLGDDFEEGAIYTTGHYAGSVLDRTTGGYIETECRDHDVSAGNIFFDNGEASIWNLPLKSDFHERVASTHDFYNIATIPFDEIVSQESAEELELKNKDFTILETFPRLEDDYQSHASIRADCLYGFNSRLYAGGVERTACRPLPPVSLAEYTDPGATEEGMACVKVYLRTGEQQAYSIGQVSKCSLWCPRYLFYPEASAYKMELVTDGEVIWSVDLLPHDFLNGAYYYQKTFKARSVYKELRYPTSNAVSPEDVKEWINVKSKVYGSEVANPFHFLASGIFTVGNGCIIALSSSTEALSQGQFGQFPLYVFTSDGIWAIEIGSDGTGRAIQPISRDVLTSRSGVLQLNKSVLFSTDRGLMAISGSTTECITEIINDDSASCPGILPRGNRMCELMGISNLQEGDVDLPSLHEFLSGCDMAFDYLHQRVLVYNPNYALSYVFSLKTKRWGQFLLENGHHKLCYSVRSYPNCLVVGDSNNGEGKSLYEFSIPATPGDKRKGMLVSRPIKLDSFDVLKTVDTILQRGYGVKFEGSALWGSRNLRDWHLVWSSRSGRLKGLCGTPYKFFRIGLICNMNESSRLFGASVSFTPRLTNRIR